MTSLPTSSTTTTTTTTAKVVNKKKYGANVDNASVPSAFANLISPTKQDEKD